MPRAWRNGTQPPGGIIPPLLAKKYPQRGKGSEKGRNAGVHLVRYADDFIITGMTKELLEHEVKPLVEEFLRARGLELSAEKTRVTHIEEGFDFLRQDLPRYSDEVLYLHLPS
jgi:RNA-directed DNA polymerase